MFLLVSTSILLMIISTAVFCHSAKAGGSAFQSLAVFICKGRVWPLSAKQRVETSLPGHQHAVGPRVACGIVGRRDTNQSKELSRPPVLRPCLPAFCGARPPLHFWTLPLLCDCQEAQEPEPSRELCLRTVEAPSR